MEIVNINNKKVTKNTEDNLKEDSKNFLWFLY